jgi:WD40 repeat protein
MIKKRGKSWWVVVYAGRDPLTGKKRQKTGTARAKAEARQLEARLIQQRPVSIWLPSPDTMMPSMREGDLLSMSDPASGRVFISYRRQETSGWARLLQDRLATRFGEEQVFMDVDTIGLGVDFAKVITQAVSTCRVLLAVIGPRWLTATDEEGQRRLDDPDDMIRLEIAAALERDILVIPILVEGAVMPRRQELPDTLAGLVRRNALSLRHDSFRSDVDRLLAAIEPLRAEAEPIRHAKAAARASPRPAQAVPGAVDRIDVVAEPSTVQVLRDDFEMHSVAFSPDGRLLAIACLDLTACLREVATGEERSRVTHDDLVWAMAFSPDGRLLATASADNTARVWDAASGQERTRVTHGGWVFGVAFSPDGRLLATASDDKSARVWEVATGEECIGVRHDDRVRAVAFSPDGRLLATASWDKTARVWEVATGQEHTRVTHDGGIDAMAFSPDGRLLATVSAGKTARVWDAASGQEHTRVTHDGGIDAMAFSPDGRLLATASDDKTARVWDAASGQERARVTHDDQIHGVAFSPDGRLLATASDDKSVRVWALVR